MVFLRVIRSVIRNLWLLILVPALMGGVVYYLTRYQPSKYDSKMTIYTGISASRIGVGEGTKLDFYTANNAIDNLISIFNGRLTMQQASLRLLALHLSLPEHDPAYLNWESWQHLRASIPEDVRNELRVDNNPEATHLKLIEFIQRGATSDFNYLITKGQNYGVEEIAAHLKATRKASSDMIEIIYESEDAMVCYYTLRYLADAYFDRYQELKRSQNNSAVEYFERQLKEALEKLRGSEEELKQFIASNKILNYYEQGKNLSIYEKEEEQEEQDVRQKATGAESALKGIEEKLYANTTRTITLDSLVAMRELASTKRAEMNALMLNKVAHADAIDKIRKEIEQIYRDVASLASSLYLSDYSVEGIPMPQLMSEWLNYFTEREKNLSYLELVKASTRMVKDRISDFAPLGAELKRLEREVSVNESQYLSILHGLNMANLQRQSAEMAGVQQVIDEPYIPSVAQKSKRALLIIAAAFAGIVFVLAGIIAFVVFNSNLLNAANTSAVTGFKVLSCFPKRIKKPTHKWTETQDMAINQLLNEIFAKKGSEKQGRTYNVVLYDTFATDKGEDVFKDLPQAFERRMTAVRANKLDEELSKQLHTDVASINWQQLPSSKTGEVPLYQLAFATGLNRLPLPIELLRNADLVLISVNAERQWKPIDRQLAELAVSLIGEKVYIILQNVDKDDLKDFFGYVPLKSWIGRSRKSYK